MIERELGPAGENLDFLYYLAQVEVISASGALSPGPLTVYTLNRGGGWRQGLLMSLGHALGEFPLILVIASGGSVFLTNFLAKSVISLAGGAMLIYLGLTSIPQSFRRDPGNLQATVGERAGIRGPIASGFLLSLFNPYFIIWWVTIGYALVLQSLELFGPIGILVFYPLHVWLDLFWLSFLAGISEKTWRRTSKLLKVLNLVFSAFLIYFGLSFIREGAPLLANWFTTP